MNTHLLGTGLLLALFAAPACTRIGTANNVNHRATRTAQNDPGASRRMITGSNVPQPVDRPTFSPTSANIPVGSASRRPDSLIPSEPTVGAGNQSTYRLNEPGTGAGPAGSTTDTRGN